MDKNNSLLRDRSHQHNNNNKTNTNNNNNITTTSNTTSSSDFVLQWGNRKRLRCMKLQQQQAAAAAAVKDKEQPAPIGQRSITPRVDHHRRAVKSPNNHQQTKDSVSNGVSYINLRQRSPAAHRVLRNSENTIGGGMKGQSNGSARRVCSPDRQVQDKRIGSNNNNNNKNNIIINNNNGGGSGSSETAHDGKKGGSSPGNEGIPVVWPPKFAIGLTNKEKEEDFLAIKGSKLPQRPKKRAKFIQRTINLVTPGGWLCDLTLERYEVREKKITKKRPRGIKAMGSMESESE
uniref:putative uncharacterized protein DDB_G0277255 n=1 Tax=Erigeron canadensis TaxID=72917 RepID=UPI001CB98819|nr:putative uncharacterized protein DDB_G0277255 [Erigeron canadensis]XP_043628447.1 putative uncharacterized protein DDB_G0277255 [Erigeron canadensis]